MTEEHSRSIECEGMPSEYFSAVSVIGKELYYDLEGCLQCAEDNTLHRK
jgi:hypothetical protein